jgi:hypothetical protein
MVYERRDCNTRKETEDIVSIQIGQASRVLASMSVGLIETARYSDAEGASHWNWGIQA